MQYTATYVPICIQYIHLDMFHIPYFVIHFLHKYYFLIALFPAELLPWFGVNNSYFHLDQLEITHCDMIYF